MSAGDVVRALLAEGETRAPASVKKFSSALRAFFRFCLVTGELDITRKRFLGAHNALLKAFTVGGQVGKPRHRMFCQLL